MQTPTGMKERPSLAVLECGGSTPHWIFWIFSARHNPAIQKIQSGAGPPHSKITKKPGLLLGEPLPCRRDLPLPHRPKTFLVLMHLRRQRPAPVTPPRPVRPFRLLLE